MNDGHVIESAVDLETGRQIRAGRDTRESKMLASTQRDGADRRSAVDPQPRFLPIDRSPDQKMILLGTNERQRFELRRGLGATSVLGRSRSLRRGKQPGCDENHEDPTKRG